MGPDLPLVSVGLPVYNGADKIRTAISAILVQTYPNLELIISDNASTDNTFEICKDFAASDSRIRLIKQTENLGPIANFEAVLKAAQGKFFMFAAADDRAEPNFIEETLAALQATQGAVACAPRTLIHFDHKRSREAFGSRQIIGSPWWRLFRFLLRPADNSRFYGLYRTTVLREAYPSGCNCHAFDWLVSALTLTQGAHLQSRSIILHRSGAERGKYYRQHLKSSTGALDQFFPAARMSVALILHLKLSQLPVAIPMLLYLNAQKSVEHLIFSASSMRRE